MPIDRDSVQAKKRLFGLRSFEQDDNEFLRALQDRSWCVWRLDQLEKARRGAFYASLILAGVWAFLEGYHDCWAHTIFFIFFAAMLGLLDADMQIKFLKALMELDLLPD